MLRSFHIFLAAVLFATAGVSDTRIEMLETTTVGEQESIVPATIWIGPDRLARISNGLRLVLDGERGTFHLIDDVAQTVRQLPMAPMGSGNPTVLNAPSETAEVNGWMAVRYELSLEIFGEPASLVVWMSEETGVKRATYFDYLERSDGGFGLAAALADLPGIPVKQELVYGDIKGRIVLESVSESEPPRGIYEIPTEYTLQ